METKTQRHFIDFLFPLTLFLLFTSLAVFIILLATNIYKDTANNSYYNDNARLSLAYVSEKIHQNNEENKISLTAVDNTDVLAISHQGEASTYYTYIYFRDGYIKELFFKEDTPVNLDFGRNISQVSSFKIDKVSPSLLSFICLDGLGEEYRTLVSLKCTN